MRKKLTISIDEGVYRELKRIPRGFSVSEFVSFMLKVMVREAKGSFRTQEDFEKWVNSDPELKKVREGIREAWGPTLFPVIDKMDELADKVKAKVGMNKRSSGVGYKK